MAHKEKEIQELQNQVDKLEQQLAEAQAVILSLTSTKEDHVTLEPSQPHGQQIGEIDQDSPLASVEHLREAILLAPYPLMIQRDDGRVVMINRAWTEITGYTLRDIPTIGEWTRKAYGKREFQTNSLLQSKGYFHDGLKKSGEVEVNTRSGEKRIWEISTAPLGMDRRGRRLMVAIGVDITERKHMEEALRLSEARYRSLVETAFEGVWVVDMSGRTTFVNRRMAEMLKYDSPKDLMDHSAFDFVPQEEREEIQAKFKARLNRNNPEHYDVRLLCRDGSVIWASAASHNLLDESGNTTGRMALFMDITARKQAEAALQKSEERFNKAFHASPSALVISRIEDGQIETVNETFVKFFGYREEEVIGKTSSELGMFANPQDRQKAVLKLLRDRFVRDFELDVRLKFGEVRNASLSIEVISIGGQNTMLTTIQDITLRKQLENELRKRESILAQAGEMAHLGAWDIEYNNLDDLNDNPLTWSGEVYRIFGYAPGEVEASNELFFAHVHPDDVALVQERVSQAIATRQPYTIEHRIIRPSGEVRVVQEHAEVFFDESGRLIRMLGAVQDITEWKRTEAALREAEIKYRTLVEHIPNAVTYMDSIDPSIGTFYVSPQIETMLGYTVEEWQGNPRSWHEHLHPEDRDGLLASDAHHEATGEPFNLEYRIVARDGRIVWVRDEAIMILDPNGKPLFSQGIMIDITEQKRAEETLRQSEERFRSLADSMPQLVWTALPDGKVDYYNQRYKEYQEIKQVETETWEWGPVLHPDDLQATIKAWQHSVVSGEVYQIEHRVRMAGGSYRWHLSRGMPMHDEKGKIIRWFGTATDIHDLKQAEEQLKVYANRLKRSNRELEQFAFMASHDLQEPLRKIEMFGDLLLERATYLNDRESAYLERMRNASGRMRDMVEGLLQLSRVATQGKPFVPVDLSQVTSEVLDDLEDQIQRLGGKVEVKPLPFVQGDPLQLHQLMQNLIGNALKYHQPDTPPEVHLHAKKLTGKVQIFVEDKGIGFHQEDAERVFQPFQRLVGRSEYEGSGMGLAICRRIVERHNGEIIAVSAPGKGATFIVTLPMLSPESLINDNRRKDANHESSGATSHR